MATILDSSGANQESNAGGDLLGNQVGSQGQAQVNEQAQGPAKEWMKGLSEPFQKSKSLSKFDNVDALAKSYTELESELGKRVRIPSRDASPDDWAKYYERVGRPKSPDEYAIDRGKTDDSLVRSFKSAAHEAGLTVEQAEKVFGSVRGFTDSSQKLRMEQYTARMKEADATLRREYGPQYDSRISDAKKAYDLLFDEALRADIVEAGLANNPRFIKVLAELGPQIRGDSFLKAAGPAGDSKKDPLAWMDKKYGSGSA